MRKTSRPGFLGGAGTRQKKHAVLHGSDLARHKGANSKHLFAFEQLEPRLLLSADLNAAAGLAIVNGLHALDTATNSLASGTALSSNTPFINRTLGDLAQLGDPIAALQTAATTYFNNNASTATIQGLAAALSQVTSATVTATGSVSGNVDSIVLTSAASNNVAATNVALSANAGGHSFSSTQSLPQTTTQNLSLTFDVDLTSQTSPVFQVQSATVSSNNEFKSTNLSGSATVDTTSETVANGSADIVANVSAQFNTSGGPLTTSTLQSTPVAQLAQITTTGNSTISAVTVSSGSTDAAEKVTASDDLSTAGSLALAVTPIPPSALEAQVLSVFNDLNSEITDIESQINNATSFAFNLPFIGNQLANDLNPQKLFQPITNEISSLETTVKIDLADSGTLLTKLQSDIVSALSSVNLLPDADPTTDVTFKYLDSDDTGTQTLSANSTVDLTHVTQLEIDLNLGQTVSSNVAIGANIGLPGLGLSLSQASHVTASVGWSFDVGLGMTTSSAYLVAGNSQDNGSPINFNVKFYLDNGFQAVGTIGFLQALLTEPNKSDPSAHTGLFGSIGIAVSGATGGTALNGGAKVLVSDIPSLSVTPNFSLNTQSDLNLAFGVNFQLDQTTGDYTDISQFPSITAQLGFTWAIDGTSLSTGSLPDPDVSLDNIEIDLGTAITDFLAPVLKPFYDATNGLVPMFDFLTSPMPIISQIIGFAQSADLPASVIQAVLPSYDPNETKYDWLNFAVDMMADDGLIDSSDAKVIAEIGNAAMQVITELDATYSAIGSAPTSLEIPLGNFSFSGKNLALPQINVTSDSQLASLGDQVGNFSNFAGAEGDSSITDAITGLMSGSPVGDALSTLQGAGNAIGEVAGDIDSAVTDVSDAASGNGGSTTTTNSEAQVTFPFFQNPDSILGLLFGQQVQFIDVNLGFSAQVADTIPLFAVSFFGILTASVELDFHLGFDVGIQFGYDSTGILDMLQGSTASGAAPSLLDGIFIGGDPLLANTPDEADVLKLDASVGVELNASLLLGLLSAGIEGGIDITSQVYVTDATPSQHLVHYDQFSAELTPDHFNLGAGELGPLSVSAEGSIFIALDYSTFWGIGPSGSIELGSFQFFQWPAKPSPQDIEPLGFYDPSTGEFDLYVGSTASKRDNGTDTPLYANPDTPQQVLANDSSTYVIDINAGNIVTVHWWNPQTQMWESQTPDGPVSEIVARTGDGNNTIIVNNDAPNTVQTDFSGTGGVQYNADQGSTTGGTDPTTGIPLTSAQTGSLIGGNDVFESGGGSSTLQGSNGNDVLVGSANPTPGSTPADSISGGNGNDTIVAGTGNSSIQAGSGNTVIYAGAGNQVIENQKPPKGLGGQLQPGDIPPVGSGGGADTMPAGNDTIMAGSAGSFSTPFGPGGDELISSGTDTDGNPVVVPGGQTDNVLVNFEGVGPGTSSWTMVDGTDEIDFSTLQSAVNINLANGTATGPDLGDVTVSGFNIIVGGPIASTLIGGTAAQGSDTIYGGSGGDSIVGGGADDVIYGATPADPAYTGNNITGGTGNDVIYGGNGHDSILGGTGNDSIIGGSDGSSIDGGTGNSTILGGAGNDSISAANGNNLIKTGDGDDSVVVGNGQNSITGGVGNDSITAGNGKNLIQGGVGEDIIVVGFGDNIINAGVGDESITAGGGENLITGDHGDDVIIVGDGENTISGGVGNDLIEAGVGSNSILGGTGNDSIIAGVIGTGASSMVGGTGANSIIGGNGNDQITVGNGNNTVYGGNGKDTITAGNGNNSITGGVGDDVITAGNGENTVYGGAGNTSITVGNGNNSITGGNGNDSITAGNGENTIYGGTGNMSITVGDGDNIIDGGIGDDIIVTGFGSDSIIGGTGNDSITVHGGNNVINAGTGNSTVVGGTGSDVITAGDGANSIVGGTGNDLISLGDGDNTVQGGIGPDNIAVGNGNNFIYGGTGNDSIVAGSGNNVIFGGQGNNWISDGAGHATIVGGGGNNTIYGGALYNLIMGGGGNDSIVAGGGGNMIIGGKGNDSIQGGAGNDVIYGGLGSNIIYGNGGADQIHGDYAGLAFTISALGVLTTSQAMASTGVSNSRNVIYGGSGADSLYGGAGSDTIYGGPGTRLIVGGGGPTLIYGGAGAGVTINGGNAGDVIIGSDGGGDSITGGAGNDRIELRGGNNYANGGGGANVIIGSIGNDVLVGASGRDSLIGGAASDQLQGPSTDSFFPNSGVTGDSLSAATVVTPPNTLSLPSDSVAQGWWSPVAGPQGMALGGSGDASSPAIAADAVGPWVAWTQTNDGIQGLYVAHDVNGTWVGVGGSVTGAGLSLAGAAASNPSIAIINGAPVVTWTSTTASGSTIEAATYSASANADAGGWVGLGDSDSATGISGVGDFDNAQIVETSAGPVITWRNLAGAAPSLYAMQYNGTAWAAFGAGAASGTGIAGSAGVGSHYSLATDGIHVAVAFSVTVANGAALQVLQYFGGAWATLASPNPASAASTNNAFSTSPSLAYFNGSLFITWVQQDQSTIYQPRLYAEKESGGVWSPAGTGAASGVGLTGNINVSGQPVLAASGSTLTLVWVATVDTPAGQTENFYSMDWNGSSFAAVQPTDVTGTGIGLIAGIPRTIALSIDPAGRVWLANEIVGDAGLNVLAGQTSAAHMFIANGSTTIASLLASGHVAAGDLILVTATTTDSTLTLGASAAGITIAGLDGVSLTNGLTIDGATGLTIRNLIVDGAVSVTNTADVTLAEDVFGSPVTLSGATGLLIRNNQLGALTIAGASQGAIHDNSFAGATTGLTIDAVFTGLIFNNDISAVQTAVVYAAAAALSNNRIHGAAIGVSTDVSDPETLFGAVAGSTPNIITQNGVGISLSNAQVIDQQITANTVGLSGSGLIGGTTAADFNLITYNQTGISSFTGLVEYNRIENNSVGIAATNGLNIFSNQIVANTTDGILISGAGNVEIAGNTIHSYVGDAIHLTGSAYNVEIVSNIIWTDTGYGIYVDNNSQTGFWSDYNTLYATGSGKIVYWTRDFTDILDWQDDVATFDLHSVGTTVVNPNWAEPHFALDSYGFEITRPLVAGQRPTDPTIGGGDPDGSFIGFNGIANLIANGNFENGLTDWTVTLGGTTSSTLQTPWQSTAEFYSGTATNSVAQQTVSLLQQGVTAAQIDEGAVQVAFGGQVSILSTAVTGAQISIQFLDGSGNAIGNAIVVPAGTSLNNWMRVFNTVIAPTGARSVEYLFSVAKGDASSKGALLDGAFLGVIPQGVGVDQGVRTSPDVIPGNSTLGRIALLSPDLYVNWDVNSPKFITWDSYGAAAGQPVSIQLWQDGTNGPTLLSTIAASTPDTGNFVWTPSQSGITAGTTGLRIRIVSVANPTIYDVSTEPFAVPEAGSTYYVAINGSNRNDGKEADAPLPNPDVVFREYAIGAGSVVNVGAGNYALIQPLQLSGTTDFGFGLDTGFTINGATGGGTVFLAANPDIVPQALIQLTGASFVSLNNLTLQGGVDALLVNGGSNNFSASFLSSTGASGAAFNITTNSSGALDHLSATGAGGAGLLFSGTMGSITNFTATGDHDGIIATGSIGLILDSTLSGNTDDGLNLTLTGPSLIEGNTITGNSIGAALIGSDVVFGDPNLADGLGNVVSGNSGEAVIANGASVVGNTISNNTERFEAVDISNGATFTDNLVFGNTEGVQINSASTVTGNRIFDNGVFGLSLNSANITVTQNTLYSNGFGILVAGTSQTISNNLIYADTYAGVILENATNVSIVNNTIYEPTAGTVIYAPNPNYNVGAVVLDGSSTGTTLSNNIIVALAGVGVQVSNNSQAGFVSDYNLFQTGAGGRVGSWLGLSQTTLSQWRTATGRDTHSQFGNPFFVSPTGTDGKLGYFSPAMNGDDDDFHVMSQQGSDHGGSLSVIAGSNGLPQLTTGAYTADTSSSPAIDGGNPATSVGAQPTPNGGIVEIGAYGGTAEASLSPSAFLTVTAPAGGATLSQGTTTSITWNSFNVSGTVDISVSADGGTTFTPLATGIANSGSYSWTIDPATYPAGATYVVEVTSTANPAVFGESSAAFTIAAPVHIYYVNGSATGGQYTTAAGSDSNNGESASAPMATLGALLAKYTLDPGDVVYVDAGVYNLTQNIIIPAADSGTGSLASQVITIQGPTQAGLTATFNRQSTASGFYDFEFKGAKNVTLSNLTIEGGATGVQIDDNTNSTGISVTNSVIEANANNIYVGIGDNNFSLTGSTISGQLSSYGVEVNTASNALIANDTIETSSAGGFQDGVYLTAVANATVSNDTFIGNGYAPTLLYVNQATNLLIDNITMSGSTYFSINVNSASGILENSTIDSSLGTTGISISGINGGGSAGMMIAEGDTVFGQIAGNAFGSAITVSNNAEVLDDIVYNSDIGITVGSTGVAQGNQVYGSRIGILVESGGTAQFNTVYNNTLGVVDDGTSTFVENNTLYNNATGIQVGMFSLSTNHAILNNTIVQSSGVALNLFSGNASDTTFLDNIVSLTNAVGIVGPAAAQVGFVSDYNLFDLEASATMATWSGQTITTLVGWKTEVALDLNSIAAVPGFVNAASDNFALMAGSPALNRGDPALQYLAEPIGVGTGNGDRIDIGAEGGTAQANPAPAQLVQLLGSTGGQRYQVGRSTTITYRSAGLTNLDPVVFINTGGGAAQGSESWNAWQANEFATIAGNPENNATPVNANGYDVPQAVLQDYTIFNAAGDNGGGKYTVPVADGAYQVSLVFVDPSSTGIGQRVFNVLANGVTEAANFDIYKTAGGANKATELTFDVTATGGQGIAVALQGITGNAVLSGIQISRVNPAPTTFTASAQVSYDNGSSWTTIATGLTFDQFGSGSFSFTPTTSTNSGLLRIVATNGTQVVSDTSQGSFIAAPAGNDFYVSATGSDLNNGKSASTPMASLAALLNVYTLQPGDTVFVGAGTYTLPTAIMLGADDSGTPGDPVQIIGAGSSTIFNRSTTAAGTPVFEIDGGHDITLENMAVTGGSIGVDLVATSGSTDISLQGLDISGFENYGVYLGAGDTGFSMTGSTINSPAAGANAAGVYVTNVENVLINDDVMNGLYYGVYVVANNFDVLGVTVSNSTFTSDSEGIDGYVPYIAAGTNYFDIEGNTITSPKYDGIYANLLYGTSTVSGNTITGSTANGIDVNISGVSIVELNQLINDPIGILASGSDPVVLNNTVTGSSEFGIEASTTGGLFKQNTISNSVVGLYADGYGTTFENNLLTGNTSIAIESSTSAALANDIFNNTIVQTGGIGVEVTTANPVDIENNIFQMTGGTVFVAPAADQAGFASNYNLFNLLGGAVMADWAGASLSAPGITVATLDDWMFGTGFDINSISGDPQFTNAAAGNYLLLSTSPGIDAGDPLSPYDQEPGNNGGRINLGIEGDTPNATQSPAVAVQVTSPNGLNKLQLGQPTTIDFSTNGVSGLQAIDRINLGGAAIAGADPATNFAAGTSTVYSVTNTSSAIDTSGVANAVPAAVYSNSLVAGAAQTLVSTMAVADGTYVVTLNFAEYANVGVGGRVFNIKINGVVVAANFDIYKAAGDQINKAVNESFTVTASGGSGIVVELDDLTTNPATLAGIEIDKPTTSAAVQTAKVEVSPDNGTTWELVGNAVPIDAYGDGSVSWTPDFITNGNTALVRVTVDGTAALSRQPFLVTNAGNAYYINDASTVGDEYTTAVGNDLNSGKTPDAPMASLTALLRNYTLGPGDIVYIDTGSYQLLTDAILGPADSGTGTSLSQAVTIQGSTDGVTTLNRENINGNVFQFDGAQDVTLADLTLTGAGDGILLDANVGSNNITVSNAIIENNENYGVYVSQGDNGFTLESSQIFGSVNGIRDTGVYLISSGSGSGQTTASIIDNQIFGQYIGIFDELVGGLIEGNSLHDNGAYGIQIENFVGGTFLTMTVADNDVFNNGNATTSNYGVYASGDVTVTGNTIFGQTATNDIGLWLSQDAVATDNTIYGNYDGVYINDLSVGGGDNRIFVNSNAGVVIGGSGGIVENDRIYSNGTGIIGTIAAGDYFNIQDNLIYDNTSGAILLSGGGTGNAIIGNTIWQSVGTSIALAGSAINTTIADNIIWGDEGTILSISANSETGLAALYNLYYRGTNGAATLISYGGTAYADLAAWQAAQPAQNVGSLEGNPDFIDIAGADNVLGGPDTPLGGGLDDNFTPGKGSPAIDASDAFLQSPLDFLGQSRHDDPATPNTGIGPPVYDPTVVAAATIPTGTALSGGQTTAGGFVTYTLPFSFNFYGVSYSKIYISPTGAIFFTQAAAQNAAMVGAPSLANLESTPMIAPFWSTIDTRFSADSIYADTSVAGYVTIRYAATPLGGNSSTPPVNFAVRLGSDGSILFEYGANLNGVSAVIGVSDGRPGSFTLASISGQTNLSNSNSIALTPNAPEGLVYYDIGAIEFQGASNNNALPEITGTVNLPANRTTTDAVFTAITLDFNETLDAISATSAANYQLIAAGPDGIFGTADDITISATPVYSATSQTVTLLLTSGALPDGSYRLTVNGSGGLLDSSGNALDGAGTGTPGSAFVSTFTIDRSADLPPVFANTNATTPDDESLPVTLQATDPEGNPITFAIVNGPSHGEINNFNATTGTFTYIPNYGYVGSDTIKFSATDSKLAQTAATLSINVTPANTAPVASEESANAIAGTPVTITLAGSDLETPANQLILAITSEPTHGVLTVTGQDTVSYVATKGYQGADSFAYTWTDTGSPAGTSGNALTSAPATVSIAVTTINHAPTTGPATIAASENQSYTFKVSDFPFADPNDLPANTLQAVIFETLPGAGTITDNNVAVVAGQAVLAADIAQGKVVFTPTANSFGSTSFTFAVEDNGGTANGGLDTSGTATATINVAQRADHPPTTGNATIGAIENTPYVFTLQDFPFADPNDTPPNALQAVVIVSLPGAGTLSLNGQPVTAGQVVLASDIAAGKLSFLAAAQATAKPYTTFQFEVQDNGDDSGGGSNTSAAATATINVTTADGAVIKNTFKNGVLYSTETDEADGSYDIHTFVGGTFGGVAYASYDNAYTTAKFRDLETFYDASGNVLASETFSPNGNDTVTIGGVVKQQKTVNQDGSYQIAFTNVTGAPYTSYTVQYGANGKAESATYSNGISALWTYNPDGTYQIAYSGVTGAAYTSYTVQYGTSGKAESATYSNGLSAAWTYNPDGSYQIAYSGVIGAAYTGYTVQYNASGKPTSAAYNNGMNEAWTYNSDGSYQISYTGLTGVGYTAYTVQYGANGKATSATYGNGQSALWTYNSDGSYQIAYSGVVGAGYTTYTVQYGANGKATSASYGNGESAVWTYNSNGSYQIAYSGVVGAGYTSYTIQYGVNGKPASATYGNGQSALWTYNSNGSYQIAYSGVVGAGYTSYTIQYGANGKATSASYSNGESAVWTYNSDGSYRIAYSGVVGAGYTSYTVQYGANGKPTSASYGSGLSAVWAYNSDGSYQIAYNGVTGAGYTSYTVQYGANGRATGASYSNGESAAWNYNSDGSYQIAYSGVAGAAYASYTVQYGTNGKPTSANYSNGMTETWTYNSDGSFQIVFAGVTGAAYTSYTVQYSANGRAASATYSNGQSATWGYNPDGSYHITYAAVTSAPYTSYTVQYGANGKPTSASFSNGLIAAWTYNPNGSYQVAYTGVPGKFDGVAYASYILSYTSTGFLSLKTYYDTGGSVVATVAYSPSGGPPTITLSAMTGSDGDDIDNQGVMADVQFADAVMVGNAVTLPTLTATGWNGTSLNLMEATANVSSVPQAASRPGAAHHAASELLVQAFVGGIVLPAFLAAKGDQQARKSKDNRKPLVLSTFDLLADRFEPITPDADPADLPSAMFADEGAVDWVIMSGN